MKQSMDRENYEAKNIRCLCGGVELEVMGRPIVIAACHCDDCQAASLQLELLPNAPRILDQAGGTAYVLYRKDRVEFKKGFELLKEYRIEQETGIRRMAANCCNTAMYLEVENGHWLSIYRDRFGDPMPKIQMHNQTKYKPEGAVIPNDAPSFSGFPFRFIAKLIFAMIAMLFGR
jgi:hypothetical protein